MRSTFVRPSPGVFPPRTTPEIEESRAAGAVRPSAVFPERKSMNFSLNPSFEVEMSSESISRSKDVRKVLRSSTNFLAAVKSSSVAFLRADHEPDGSSSRPRLTTWVTSRIFNSCSVFTTLMYLSELDLELTE